MKPDGDARRREIELISDEHGLAMIADPAAMQLFLAREGLESKGASYAQDEQGAERRWRFRPGRIRFAANAGR